MYAHVTIINKLLLLLLYINRKYEIKQTRQNTRKVKK